MATIELLYRVGLVCGYAAKDVDFRRARAAHGVATSTDVELGQLSPLVFPWHVQLRSPKTLLVLAAADQEIVVLHLADSMVLPGVDQRAFVLHGEQF